MKGCRWIPTCFVLGALVFWGVTPAAALTVSGQASTEVEWFDTADEETAVPGYQYLLLNVRDIDGQGLKFKGYGRLSTDLADEVDADSRLYTAYLEKDNLFPKLEFRLGRQFISTTAGASVMDGLFVDYSGLGFLGIKLFGGGDVAYYESYSAKDLIDGAELYGRFYDRLDLGLSYVQRWEEGELANELFGLDADYEQPKLFNLYSELQFDYLTNSVSYFLGGFNYHRNPRWSFRSEYLYSLPVFSSLSIYSVFAVDEYQEVMGEFTYNLDYGMRSFVRYTYEIYQSFDDAHVLEAGLEKVRTRRCSGYLTLVLRDHAQGQDLMGIKARGAYLFNRYLQAGLGVHLDVLERRIDVDEDDSTSSRVWADATAYLTRKINLQAKVERIDSDLYDHYYRGRVRLNILF